MDEDSKLPARKQVEVSFDNVDSREWSPDEDENVLHVVVKRTGMAETPCLELTIERDATVMNLKRLIQDELADESPCLMVPVERQRLIFQGKMLTNDEHSLLDDLRMKPEKVNYVHLAPLPKGATPSVRKRTENKSAASQRQRMRGSRRAQRAFNPYNISALRNTPDPMNVSSSSSSAAAELQELSRVNQWLCDRYAPRAGVFDGQLGRPSLAGLLQQPSPSSSTLRMDTVLGLSRPLGETPTRDVNSILSLCQLLPRSLSHQLAPTRTPYADHVNETIVLLDEMSQRCASLSSSLRSNRQNNNSNIDSNSLPVGLQGIHLPLGYF